MVKQMARKYLIATHEGTLQIGNYSIPCAVLEDGRRILYFGEVKKLIGQKGRNEARNAKESLDEPCINPGVFLLPSNIKPFASNSLQSASTFTFKTKKGQIVRGCQASVLTELINAYLEARRTGKLYKNQLHIAEACELLLRAFGKVGITALVDEKTGYRAKKKEEKLSTIFDRYLADPSQWTRLYKEDLCKEMKRLRVPAPWGTRFIELVYIHFPGGVEFVKELNKRNPRLPCSWRNNGARKLKHHQLLSDEKGKYALQSHLNAVLALMRASHSYLDFMQKFHKAFPKDTDDAIRILRQELEDPRQLSLFGDHALRPHPKAQEPEGRGV